MEFLIQDTHVQMLKAGILQRNVILQTLLSHRTIQLRFTLSKQKINILRAVAITVYSSSLPDVKFEHIYDPSHTTNIKQTSRVIGINEFV
jgi:hypothetical protein